MLLAETVRALCGAIMLDPDQLQAVLAMGLRPSHIPEPNFAALFAVMAAIAEEGGTLDLVVVASRLDRAALDGIGGCAGLASMEQGCLASAAAPDYAETIMRAAQLRALGETAERLRVAASADGSVESIVEATRRSLEKILVDSGTDDCISLGAAVDAAIEDATRAKADGCSGLKLGIPSLDKILGGLKPGTLTILAARPSIGKTALALNIALHVAMDDKTGVAFYSLEMSATELGLRCACRKGKVDLSKAHSGFASREDLIALADARRMIGDCPFAIYDSTFTLDKILSRARRDAMRGEVGLIVIDYLQLVSGPRGAGINRVEEVSAISRSLKLLAKELGVPVLALSQLSRGVEQRSTTANAAKPQLSDLRDSGAIEQDADAVLFLHCGAPPTERHDVGLLDAIIAKNRSGKCGTVCLAFNRTTQHIGEPSRQ